MKKRLDLFNSYSASSSKTDDVCFMYVNGFPKLTNEQQLEELEIVIKNIK